MSTRNNSNRITIIPQKIIDEEEAGSDISRVNKYNAIILKSAKMKLLEEEIFQVAKQVGKILRFQEICGVTGMLEFEVRNDEVMNEKPKEGPGIIIENQWRRHLYIS